MFAEVVIKSRVCCFLRHSVECTDFISELCSARVDVFVVGTVSGRLVS